MALHMIKLAVSAESVEHVRRWQSERRARQGALFHFTRMTPRRAEEILEGGSIYWVIKGLVQARQRILAIERVRDGEGRPTTRLTLDPILVRTLPQACRAFQGWRYLEAEAAPPDLESDRGRAAGDVADMPAEMLAELRDLGLL
ncbi:MAG: DUF1489 domain-containing protein [Kiloniellales bacterium]|nr:DUF1489 domain-containing protein [Kiloniellales bacterium]